MVVSSVRFCITRWLPQWRTATNPFRSSIRQTSSPKRTRSLPNRNLDLGNKDFVAEAAGDLGGIRGFEEQGKCLH